MSSTISTDLERLGYNSPAGCIATGLHRQVIQSEGATRTLLPEESGSLVVFDAATGHVFTLPDAVEGMQFDFIVKTAVTSNAHKVITADAATFLTGAIMSGVLLATMDVFQGNGSTHVAVSSNGSTTGGLVGSWMRFTCLSSTLWAVEGVFVGSGTLADPFATS